LNRAKYEEPPPAALVKNVDATVEAEEEEEEAGEREEDMVVAHGCWCWCCCCGGSISTCSTWGVRRGGREGGRD